MNLPFTISNPMSRNYPRLLHVALLLLTAHLAFAATETKRPFDLPADSAEKTLKFFSEQSGHGLIMGADAVGAARTNAVRGEFTAPEALARMLAGTGLLATQDAKSRAFVVHGEKPDPNAPTAVVDPSLRPARQSNPSEPAKPVVLSPFEVSASGDRGYYGANTMSGTRLNSKIEDLASSITVVTKEQMQDFAMLDINDIFKYEASTEGTGNYSNLTFDSNGGAFDGVQTDPNNSNRIRGIGNANISFGNFETSGRVPLDPIMIDAVEISRGANSSIFGLGNAAGTVNVQVSSANLSRNTTQVTGRGDSFGGFRGSLDFNRVLSKGILAFRGSAVTQHDAFVRKPSGTNTARFNGMVKFQPFKATTLSASYSYYHIAGNRPNSTPPRDAISWWKENGSPTWHPITQQIKRDGSVIATFATNNNLPSYFNTTWSDRPSLFVDTDGLKYWTVNQTGNTNNPNARNLPVRFMTTNPEPIRVGQPLFATVKSATDKSLYDWSSINIAAPSWFEDQTETSSVQLDQLIIHTGRQTLAAQVGWYREDSERTARNLIATGGGNGLTGLLQIDVNERLLDGTPNPFFLRPYIGENEKSSYQLRPLQRDNYRVQLAYQGDLSKEKNALRWLGLHRAVGYYEFKRAESLFFSYRDVITSDHPWLVPPAAGNGVGLIRGGTSGPHPLAARTYVRYYLGDNQGANVDYAPGKYHYGTYPFHWYNGATGNWVAEPVSLGQAATPDASGNGTLNVLKTQGGTLQSFLLQGRVVTTFGMRKDRSYNRAGKPVAFTPDGLAFDYAAMDGWRDGDWRYREGSTRTSGVVVKPFRWLSLHANKSDSFRPSTPAQTIYRVEVPDPQGKNQDVGFSLSFLDGKLNVRANQYVTKEVNRRTGGFVTNLLHVEFWSGGAGEIFALEYQANRWLSEAATARGVTLTPSELRAQTAQTMGLGQEFFDSYAGNVSLPYPVTETENVVSHGREIEINYNPTNFWTMKLNVTESETLNATLSPNVLKWIRERVPVYEKIIDPSIGRPWFTERYGNFSSASQYLNANVIAPLKLSVALEGKSRPQIRKYRANFSTNYRLAGLSENKYLKRINVIGAVRWEDKGAINYYGLQQYPATITEYDPTRPIYDKAHTYIDVGAAYRTRLFAEKVGATFQVNVRNVQESGRLQPVNAYPNGVANSYRIIDPRQFVLSVTFDL